MLHVLFSIKLRCDSHSFSADHWVILRHFAELKINMYTCGVSGKDMHGRYTKIHTFSHQRVKRLFFFVRCLIPFLLSPLSLCRWLAFLWANGQITQNHCDHCVCICRFQMLFIRRCAGICFLSPLLSVWFAMLCIFLIPLFMPFVMPFFSGKMRLLVKAKSKWNVFIVPVCAFLCVWRAFNLIALASADLQRCHFFQNHY